MAISWCLDQLACERAAREKKTKKGKPRKTGMFRPHWYTLEGEVIGPRVARRSARHTDSGASMPISGYGLPRPTTLLPGCSVGRSASDPSLLPAFPRPRRTSSTCSCDSETTRVERRAMPCRCLFQLRPNLGLGRQDQAQLEQALPLSRRLRLSQVIEVELSREEYALATIYATLQDGLRAAPARPHRPAATRVRPTDRVDRCRVRGRQVARVAPIEIPGSSLGKGDVGELEVRWTEEERHRAARSARTIPTTLPPARSRAGPVSTRSGVGPYGAEAKREEWLRVSERPASGAHRPAGVPAPDRDPGPCSIRARASGPTS